MNHPRILSSSIGTLTALVAKRGSLAKWRALGLGLSLAGFSSSASAQSNQTWNHLSSDNTWNLTSTNWDAGLTWMQNNNATFGGSGETIVLGPDAIIFNDLTFGVSGYTIAAGAGSLILGNDQASAITVSAGTATITETMPTAPAERAR